MENIQIFLQEQNWIQHKAFDSYPTSHTLAKYLYLSLYHSLVSNTFHKTTYPLKFPPHLLSNQSLFGFHFFSCSSLFQVAWQLNKCQWHDKKHLVHFVIWLAIGRVSNCRNHTIANIRTSCSLRICWILWKVSNPCQYGKRLLSDNEDEDITDYWIH